MLLLLTIPAQAEHMPLWQLGVGVGVLHAPFYRGSKAEKTWAVPFPFPLFRGRRFRSDEDGMRGSLFKSQHLKLDFSAGGNVPVPSDVEGARKDMPGLDTVGEVGPELKASLWKSNDKRFSLSFNVPVRAVISIGDPLLKYQGLIFSPHLQLQRLTGRDNDMWRYRISAGPIFSDQRYHNYFYEVGSGYTTNERPEYHPDGGYSGSRLTLTFARYTRRFFFGAIARADTLSGAAFEDSPLVETKRYLVAGFMFAWIFSAADTPAEHD